MRSGHAPGGRLAFDADRQLGVGNVLAIAARSLLGSSCVVSRVFVVDERGAYEIGCSGDRMMRAPDASVRERAVVATDLVSGHVGFPAGFQVAAVAGRARGRVASVLEVIARAPRIEAQRDEMGWLATVAAMSIVEMLDNVVPLQSSLDDRLRAADLTVRERQVLGLLGEGATSKLIAQHLGISLNTVRTHIQNVRLKLGVSSRLEAAAMARRIAATPPAGEDIGA